MQPIANGYYYVKRQADSSGRFATLFIETFWFRSTGEASTADWGQDDPATGYRHPYLGLGGSCRKDIRQLQRQKLQDSRRVRQQLGGGAQANESGWSLYDGYPGQQPHHPK